MAMSNGTTSRAIVNHGRGDVNVAVRLNRLDRFITFARTLTYSSTINIVASRFENVSSEQNGCLRRFERFIRSDYPDLFPIERPTLDIFLVLLRSADPRSPNPPEVRICLGGMRSQREIKHFHHVLEQPHCRVHYAPLNLCYNTYLVENTGTESLRSMYLITKGSETFCGSLLESNVSKNCRTQTCTIGGIINIKDRSCAVTLTHQENQHGRNSNTSKGDGGYSSGETFLGIQTMPYLEPPLIIDSWKNDTEVDSWDIITTEAKVPTTEGQKSMLADWVPKDKDVLDLDGWALIPIPPGLERPNSWVMPESLGAEPKPRYIVDFSEEDGRFPVTIIAGISETKVGMLSRSISFIVQENGSSQEVWTATLPHNELLRRGDSGSWVVRQSDNTLVGAITATSAGIAYIVPVSDLLGKIRQHFGRLPTISMPVPFVTFLSLSTSPHYSQDPTMRNRFCYQAISEESLMASAKDTVARCLTRAVGSGKSADVHKLAKHMEFDYGAMVELIRALQGLNPIEAVKDIPRRDNEILTLARIVFGDGELLDSESREPGKIVDSSRIHEATATLSTKQRIRDKLSLMLSRRATRKDRTTSTNGRSKASSFRRWATSEPINPLSRPRPILSWSAARETSRQQHTGTTRMGGLYKAISSKRPKTSSMTYLNHGQRSQASWYLPGSPPPSSNAQNEHFIPRNDIDLEVITANIRSYLGNDASVRPGYHEMPGTVQAVQGYFITAYKNLTSAMIEDLQADSAARQRYQLTVRNTVGVQPRNSATPHSTQSSSATEGAHSPASTFTYSGASPHRDSTSTPALAASEPQYASDPLVPPGSYDAASKSPGTGDSYINNGSASSQYSMTSGLGYPGPSRYPGQGSKYAQQVYTIGQPQYAQPPQDAYPGATSMYGTGFTQAHPGGRPYEIVGAHRTIAPCSEYGANVAYTTGPRGEPVPSTVIEQRNPAHAPSGSPEQPGPASASSPSAHIANSEDSRPRHDHEAANRPADPGQGGSGHSGYSNLSGSRSRWHR